MTTRRTTKTTAAPKTAPKYAALPKSGAAHTRMVSAAPSLQQLPRASAPSGLFKREEPLPTKLSNPNPKDAIASTKLPLHLWPATATAMGCLGMLVGRQVYGRENFRTLGALASVYVDACKRHLDAWMEGEDLDPDSRVPHLAHALSCLAILVDTQAAGVLTDDRCSPGGYRNLVTELTPLVRQVLDQFGDTRPVHYTIQGPSRG